MPLRSSTKRAQESLKEKSKYIYGNVKTFQHITDVKVQILLEMHSISFIYFVSPHRIKYHLMSQADKFTEAEVIYFSFF